MNQPLSHLFQHLESIILLLNHLFLHLELIILPPLQNTQQLKNLVSKLNSIMIELINIWQLYNKT